MDSVIPALKAQLNEKEKKKNYKERILEVEHGSFTPIVVSAYVGIRKEGNKFYNRLAELLAEKKNQQLSMVTSWIKRKLIFALINSICMCIRVVVESSKQIWSALCNR